MVLVFPNMGQQRQKVSEQQRHGCTDTVLWPIVRVLLVVSYPKQTPRTAAHIQASHPCLPSLPPTSPSTPPASFTFEHLQRKAAGAGARGRPAAVPQHERRTVAGVAIRRHPWAVPRLLCSSGERTASRLL
eukprot:352223-Chlamydomonas_euryale.AAC.12